MKQYEITKTDVNDYRKFDFAESTVEQLVGNGGVKAEYETKFWLAYNTDGIIFRFECADDNINCTMTEYNEPIYEEETVELFFAANGDLHNYLEMEWNGLNTAFCANIYNDLNGRTEIELVKENIIESNVEVVKNGWIIKGFIPKKLFKGKMDGEWLFNAYRIKRRQDKSMILMAYSPTFEDNFHKPEKFGKIKFKK